MAHYALTIGQTARRVENCGGRGRCLRGPGERKRWGGNGQQQEERADRAAAVPAALISMTQGAISPSRDSLIKIVATMWAAWARVANFQ